MTDAHVQLLTKPVNAEPWLNICGALEAEQGSAYILASDLTLLYVNSAWSSFARANGAPDLGTGWAHFGPISQAFPPLLFDSLVAMFARVLARNESFCHVYECSSPSTYRKFNMRVEPTPLRDGLIVVNSLVVEALFNEGGQASHDQARLFTDSQGRIVQCASCGRVRRPDAASAWEWVPGLVKASMEHVSHGLCPICDFRYYGDQYPPPEGS